MTEDDDAVEPEAQSVDSQTIAANQQDQAELQNSNKPSSATKKNVLRWALWLVVAGFVAWTAWQGHQDLTAQQDLRWRDFRWQWLPLSVLLYFLGMAPSWLYWHWILRRFGFQTGFMDSFRAFYLSQLGKYVPGKVMVILIRTATLCHRPISNPASQSIDKTDHHWVVVSATALMETLTFISVGGMIGALAGTYYFADQLWVVALAVSIALSLPIPILPPVFRLWIRHFPLVKTSEAKDILCQGWSWKALSAGFLLLPVGWLGLGACLWSLFLTLPPETLADTGVTARDYWPALTCVSLANVLGFVSLIPGGFGVREVVMYPILENRFSLAIVIVILYRLTSLTAELVAAGVAWLTGYFVKTDQAPIP